MTDDTKKTFAERLDAYGPEFSRWPEDMAEHARAWVARSDEARALHNEARRLAALIAEAAEAEAPNGLAFRIVAEVAARRADRLSRLAALFGSPRRFGLAGAGVGAAAVAAGVALGAIAGPAQAGGGVASLDLGAALEVSLADGDL